MRHVGMLLRVADALVSGVVICYALRKYHQETTMSNPAMPNLPGFGTITDTMELVRNMWGGMSAPGVGIPGMVMPTLSVEEINKQISDLKAVESWLTLNMNMLRGTIQALEVQSATISTLKSMGETLSASVKQGTAPAQPAAQGFPFSFGTTATPAPAQPTPEVPKPFTSAFASGYPFPQAAAGAPVPEQAEVVTPPPAAPSPTGIDTAAATPLANPAVWWNMLQDQFKHAVQTAMATEPVAADASPMPPEKPAAKAAAKKPASKAAKKPDTKAPLR